MVIATSVVGEMKMGNTMPRARLEATSLAFRASLLPLHYVGCHHYTHAHLSIQLFASEVSADIYKPNKRKCNIHEDFTEYRYCTIYLCYLRGGWNTHTTNH